MTKKLKTELSSAILYSYDLGKTVDIQGDIDFLMALFENHPEWGIKEGVGVDTIGIASGQYGTRHFVIRRVDGTSADISFIQCINEKTTKVSDIKVACRTAIRPTIDAYRLVNFISGTTKCAITSEVLFDNTTHIDHYDLTFHELFGLWIIGKNIDELFKKLNDRTIDHETRIYFMDEVVNDDFIEFHNQHTHLRVVSKLANLSLLRKSPK